MNKMKRKCQICGVIVLITAYILFGLTSCFLGTKDETTESIEEKDLVLFDDIENISEEPVATPSTTTPEEVIDASVNLENTTLQVASEISGLVTTFSDSMEEDMAKIVGIMSQYNETLRNVSNESAAVHRENARIFYEMANEEDSENRNLYYLAAIIQDPTNASYCWSYISYLDDNAAPSSDYYTLGSLVENTILNNSYSDVKDLIEVYNYIVDNLLVTTEKDDTNALEESREEALATLTSDINKVWSDALRDSSYEKFMKATQAITARYSLLSDYVDSSVGEKYELILSVENLFEDYNSSLSCIDGLASMDNSEFEFAYPYVASILDETVSAAILVDSSSYGVFSSLVDSVKDRIKTGVIYLNSRFDSIVLSELDATSKSILGKIKNDGVLRIANDFVYDTVKAEYEAFINDYSMASASLRGSEEASVYIDEINENISDIYTAIYKYEYEKYQIWAATLMLTLKTDVEKAKNNQKLEVLYKGGYYTINPNYLMPKLQTLYTSLYEENYTKNSAKSDVDLMLLYGVDIKELGEV